MFAAEAAQILGIGRDTLIRLTDAGEIPCWRPTSSSQRRYDRGVLADIRAKAGAPAREAGSASARVALVLAGTAVFGTVLGVATARPVLVLALLMSVLVVGAVAVLAAAAVAVVPEVLGALVDEARIRHRAGMARLRADAMRRHPAGTTR